MKKPPSPAAGTSSVLQVSGLLILGVFFSTFLVESSQTIGQWIGCFLDPCADPKDEMVFKYKAAGLAIGGFLAIGLATAALARGAVSLVDGLGTAIGVLAGALFSILELSVSEKLYPEPGTVVRELYIWAVIAVLMIGPLMAKGASASARNISHIYGRMVCAGLLGLLCAWLASVVLAGFGTVLGPNAGKYILRPYSVITLPAMWALMLAIPWLPGSRGQWKKVGHKRWIVTMGGLTVMLAGGYGLTESVQSKQGVTDAITGIALSLALFLPAICASLCAVALRIRRRALPWINARYAWPVLVIAFACLAGWLTDTITQASLGWTPQESRSYAVSHGLSVAIAAALSYRIDDIMRFFVRLSLSVGRRVPKAECVPDISRGGPRNDPDQAKTTARN